MYPALAAELYNRSQKEELGNLFRHSTRLALGMLIPAIVGLALISDPLLRLFATDAFAVGAPVMPVIALGYMLLMLAAYFDVALGLAGKQVWSTVAVCVAAGANILLNLWWIPSLGITGAALATLVGFALQLGLVMVPGRHCMDFPFDWLFLGKVCAATAGMTGAVWLLPKIATLMWLVVNIVCGMLAYAAVMLACGAVSRQEWTALLRMLRGGTTAR
jgi:O-antigen/teichoic acid export membrane protein